MAEAQLAVPSGASLPANSSAPSWATGVKRAARYTPSNAHNFPRGTRSCGPPSPGWRNFLRNHTAHIAAIDLFVVSTIGFKLLYGLVILRLERRQLVWTNVTAKPTADWIAR